MLLTQDPWCLMVPDPAPWREVWLKQKAQLALADTSPGACGSWWIKNNTGPGGTRGLFETFLSISSWLLAVITAVEFLKPVRASFKAWLMLAEQMVQL